MYYRMAQVTFTLPVSEPLVSFPAIGPPASKFSWDTVFTIILLMCICCFGWLWVSFLMNSSEPVPQCTPDGSLSTGSNGSDCCSTNGIDVNGNCQPRSPMGVPQYGTTSNQIPPTPAPPPASQPSPPIPYVSSPAPSQISS